MSKKSSSWTSAEMFQLFQIVVIFIAADIETDIYLPAFPDMMKAFQVSEAEIQQVLSWNFIALCLSGLIYGAVSDATGRKKPLLLALGLFFLGSIFTVVSEDFSFFLFGRVLQGLGSGGCFTLGSAVIFDVFSSLKALKAMNFLNIIIPLFMTLAPPVGGFLNQAFGFRANFWVVTALVFLSLLMSVLWFQETLPKEQRKPLKFSKLWLDYQTVFSSSPFWQLNLPICLLFGGYLAFLSISSVLFVLEFKVSKTVFPYFQLAVLGGWLAASLSSNAFLSKWGTAHAKKVGIIILGISFICFQLTCWIAPKNPYLLTLFMVTYAFGYNWLQTPYFEEIMGLMPDIKGLIGSLVTSFRLLFTAVLVAVTGHYYNQNIMSYSMALWGVALVIVPMIYLRERGQRQKT